MHILHKWSKWEQYVEKGVYTYCGVLIPKEIRGNQIPYTEDRQRRTCKICGKMQDVKI